MGQTPTIALDGAFSREPLTGSGQYTLGLWSQFSAGDVCCRVVLLLPGSGSPGAVPPRLLRTGKPAKLWWEQRGVVEAAQAAGAALLHVPYFAGPLRSPLPLVVTVHDVIPLLFPAYRASLAMRLYLRLVSRVARRADAVITDSEHSKRDIMRVLGIPAERITAIPLAADPRFRPATDLARLAELRQRFDLPGPVIFNVGGLDVRKNLPALIAAFALALPDLDPATRLVIAGRPHAENPRLYPPLEPVVRRFGLEGHVVLPGAVSEEDKLGLYQIADLYVYPSLYEGFGLSPLEAMACGTPVIAANRSSLPEVVGDGGLLVEPEPGELARAIRQVLLDDRLREDLARRALKRAAQFSWERTARETIAVYYQVLGRRAAHRGADVR
ncbi:Mannosylfructose-phosphate synthase [bacterium HR26]|nr:Mannosylfructose-phosphate synthase [bacterium HR26]